jgi:endonuclease/exonuclease/phosphatase family metal-dependent hydrolase
MGLGKKVDALLSLNPDLAVIPECSEKSAIALQQRGFNSLWFGTNPHKGLGVICRQDWPLHALQQPEQKWIVAIEVDAPTPFTLIAIWACRVGSTNVHNYVGQVYYALASHPEWFNGSPVVLAGDLNSNKGWDERHDVTNHSSVVSILAERGLVSGYHEYFSEPQGMETRPTLHFYRRSDRTFHIDYVFVPRTWTLRTVEVGKYEQWSELSDHCPVVVEVEPSAT